MEEDAIPDQKKNGTAHHPLEGIQPEEELFHSNAVEEEMEEDDILQHTRTTPPSVVINRVATRCRTLRADFDWIIWIKSEIYLR